jgi:uncharacterized Ntn-hydrolase superfamily protein
MQTRFLPLAVLVCAAILTPARNLLATWSFVVIDRETREVGIGSATCLSTDNPGLVLDQLKVLPVIIPDLGGAIVQARADLDGLRRPIIRRELLRGTSPEEILAIVSQVEGHSERQYVILDAEGRSGLATGVVKGYAETRAGEIGNVTYAIVGGVLAGRCVVDSIEEALRDGSADVPGRIMAAMEAASAAGGDGRCSCSVEEPTECGCAPPDFQKSAHIGAMVVARVGDTDDPVCDSAGCADGDYYMKLSITNQAPTDTDPVLQLREAFDDWRADLVGRPDAVQSRVTVEHVFDPDELVRALEMRIELRDWQGAPVTTDGLVVTVQHEPESDGVSEITPVIAESSGLFTVRLDGAKRAGVDRFRVVAIDGVRPVTLTPSPELCFGDQEDGELSACVSLGPLFSFRNLGITAVAPELTAVAPELWRKWVVFMGQDDRTVQVYNLDTGATTDLGLVPSRLEYELRWWSLSGRWLAFVTEDHVLHKHDMETGTTTNLGLIAHDFSAAGRWLVARGPRGVSIHDLESGETLTLDLAVSKAPHLSQRLTEEWLALSVREARVVHVHSLETGQTENLGLAGTASIRGSSRLPREGELWRSDDGDKWLVLQVWEGVQGDLNEDGDRQDDVVHVHDFESGETRNLGVVARTLRSADWLVLEIQEPFGEDLNGDGDAGVDLDGDGVIEGTQEFDRVAHVLNLATGAKVVNLRLALSGRAQLWDNWLFLPVSEKYQGGEDLNGDGDSEDTVCFVHDLRSGNTSPFGTPEFGGIASVVADRVLWAIGRSILFYNLENGTWEDLGSTGSIRTAALNEKRLLYTVRETPLVPSPGHETRDLNGDGDTRDLVLHVLDLETGAIANAALAIEYLVADRSGSRYVVAVDEAAQGARDLNGDGDARDVVLHLAELIDPAAPVVFLRGDCDADGTACSGVNDALTLLSWLFRGDTRPPCIAACDADGNGEAELTDAVYGLDYCFTGTAPPPPPFPACGPGTEDDAALGCTLPADGCQ